MQVLNLLLNLKYAIAAGVGKQGNWDYQSDRSVRLGSHPAVGARARARARNGQESFPVSARF